MKKLLAIALVLMLLTASAAFAETAVVTTYSNPTITVTQGDETNTVDLAGVNVVVAMGLEGEAPQDGEVGADTRVPTVLLDATKDGQSLLSGEVQFMGTRMVVNLDGLSKPLSADMSMAGDTAVSGYRTLFAALPEIAKTKLPAFTGVDIPKIDLMSVSAFLPMLGIQPETTDNSASFEIPAEMVSALLGMIVQQIPAEALQSTGLADMLQNGGFALKGNITDDGATASLVLDIYAAENGQTAADPMMQIAFVSAANSDTLTVDLMAGDQRMTLGQLALTSLPQQAELDLSFELMQGVISLAGSLYPQDGAQVAALEFNLAGGTETAQKINTSLIYGDKDGAEFVDFAFAIDGQVAMDAYTETTGDGNGNETGTLTVTLDNYNEPQSNIVLNSELEQKVVDDYTFRDIENAAGAIELTTMTEEQSTQLQQEFGEILGKLMGGLGDLAPAA